MPPTCRQVIGDYARTFFKAALVPAANVYLSLEADAQGPFLREAVAALKGPPPAERLPHHEQRAAKQVPGKVVKAHPCEEHVCTAAEPPIIILAAAPLTRCILPQAAALWEERAAAVVPGSAAGGAGGSRASGSKVPKWMKVGGK